LCLSLSLSLSLFLPLSLPSSLPPSDLLVSRPYHWWLHSLAHSIRMKSHRHPGWLQYLCVWLIRFLFSQFPDNLISNDFVVHSPQPSISRAKSGLITSVKWLWRCPNSNHSVSSFPVSHWLVLLYLLLDLTKPSRLPGYHSSPI
jgi:hypothetical protein